MRECRSTSARSGATCGKPTADTNQTVVGGMGELRLDILVDRMHCEFKVEANVGKQQVGYKDSIRRKVENVEDIAVFAPSNCS